MKTPLKTFTNPQGIFAHYIPFSVDETSLNDHLLGAMTHVKWITDKETGRFYGSAFAEIRSAAESSSIVNEVCSIYRCPDHRRPIYSKTI